MKVAPLSRLITFAPIALMGLCYVGCHSDDSPPQSVAINANKNEVTDRERLVQEFHTTEILLLPYSALEFIVRDTNGVVWYVNTTDSNHNGKTRLFAPFDDTHEIMPPDYSGFKERQSTSPTDELMLNFLLRAMEIASRSNIVVFTTNVYSITNYDGAEPALPPQMGAKIAVMINKRISEFARTNHVWMEEPEKKK